MSVQDTPSTTPQHDTADGAGSGAAPKAQMVEPSEPKAAEPDSDSGTESAEPPAEPDTAETPTYDPLTDPKVQARIRAESEKAAKKAAQKARAEAEAEAKKKADRAKLDEVERLKAERQDALDQVAKLEAQHGEAIAEQQLTNALIAGNHRLAGGSALDFLRIAAKQAVASDEELSMEQAVADVLAANPFLVKAPEPQAPQAPQQGTQRPNAPAPDTQPAGQPRQPAPRAAKKPTPTVDTMSMTPAEYEKHRREVHGLN